MYKISAENLQALFQKIAADQDLYLPVKVSDQVNFRAWSQDAEVCLDTLKTVKSPKDALFLLHRRYLPDHLKIRYPELLHPVHRRLSYRIQQSFSPVMPVVRW